MFSVRNTILAALSVFFLVVVLGVLALLGPPDSHGAAVDSYGTRREGFRAVFELLQSFHVRVERRTEPPSYELPPATTFVLWLPHHDLVANEPAYFENLLNWVEKGGRLVVSVPPPGRDIDLRRSMATSKTSPRNIWTALKLDDVRTIPIVLKASAGDTTKIEELPHETDSSDERRRQLRRSLEQAIGLHTVQFTTVDVAVTGAFLGWMDSVQQLQVPNEKVGGLQIGGEPSGTIVCQRSSDLSWTVAASFSRGEGEIIVVAEPMLLMNASLAQADNSVLAYQLLTSGGRNVVFDEFYHGLSIRGNPLWLLTKSTYAVLTLVVLAVLSIILWRRAIALGPPLETPPRSRRSLGEYLDAMARFLNQGRKSRSFLLSEVRAGTLRTVGERCGLSPAEHDPDVIASSLARRSPVEASHFRQSIQLLDSALAKGPSLTETETIRVMQRISSCL